MAAKNNRQAFFETLEDLAESDERIILIVGDVGFSYLDRFIERFPNQFLNAGVTEQSFMGLAAGMALSGWKPYVYSMIPFVMMRNYEQLRNDVCYNNANVKILGVRGSVHYKFLGMSHNLQGTENEEDLLKNLPHIQRYYPDSPEETKKAVLESYELASPCYIRL